MSPEARELPALFKGEMVCAIYEGRKSHTRRVVKGAPEFHERARFLRLEDGVAWFGDSIADDPVPIKVRCPYGKPGDRLWVREVFARGEHFTEPEADCVCYRADGAVWTVSGEPGLLGEQFKLTSELLECQRWKPSIHMPRWASRLTLEVTDVRVERLREISEADAQAEGVKLLGEGWWALTSPYQDVLADGVPDASHKYRYHFAALWDDINAARGYSWESNPWVWVVVFRRLP